MALSTIKGLGQRQATTVAGNAATLITGAGTDGRGGLLICNTSGTYELWVRLVDKGDTAPTISATDYDFVIGAKQTLTLRVDDGVQVYIQNSSGAATTTNFTATEFVG